MSNNSEPLKVRTTVIVSGKNQFTMEDIKAVLRGAGLAIASAVILAIIDYVNKLLGDPDFVSKMGIWAPFVSAIIAVVINVVRKYLSTDIYPSDNSKIE